PTRSNFQLEKFVTPSGMLAGDDEPDSAGACVVCGGGAGGAAVCASAAAAHKHATHDSRKSLVALRYTSDLMESTQDITPFETLADRAGEKNRSRHAYRSSRRQRRV